MNAGTSGVGGAGVVGFPAQKHTRIVLQQGQQVTLAWVLKPHALSTLGRRCTRMSDCPYLT